MCYSFRNWLVLPFVALFFCAGCETCDCEGRETCANSTDSSGDVTDSSGDFTDSSESALDTGDAAQLWRDGFSFVPSNISLLELDTVPADVRFEGAGCAANASINTDSCTAHCLDLLPCRIAVQADGSEVAVISAHAFFVAAGVVLSLEGSRPLMVMADEEVTINGAVVAREKVYVNRGVLGGAGCPNSSTAEDGLGVGGGGASFFLNGAGGGGYCGLGGEGGDRLSDEYVAGAAGGKYGNELISPLTGGSAGGKGKTNAGGAGGGAVQFVAGIAIVVGPQGSIDMGGQGGRANAGNGGGSGGAILLESPRIAVAGVLAANGGGGGAGDLHTDGLPASASNEPALGGRHATLPSGGDGSAASNIDGNSGESTKTAEQNAGGGGGGAGRIRLNASSGGLEITGVVSPSVATGCATSGLLEK